MTRADRGGGGREMMKKSALGRYVHVGRGVRASKINMAK